MPGGAPKGNQNAAKGRDWREALRYALARRGREKDAQALGEPGEAASIRGLRLVALKFIEAAENGDPWAMKELGDRIEGKAPQAIDLSGQLDVPMSGTVKIVKSNAETD